MTTTLPLLAQLVKDKRAISESVRIPMMMRLLRLGA